MFTLIQTDNLISGMKSVVPFSKNECDELNSILRDISGEDSTLQRTVCTVM